jgi:release factor glutamine methyltransferase
MNVQDAIKLALEVLQPKQDRYSASTDAEFLLVHCLDKSFTWLKTWPEYVLSQEQENRYQCLLNRRQQGEPIAYLTGEKAFWSLVLETNASTLIPRSETELLVEMALEYLAEKTDATILDLGTGTGAIALSIAAEREGDQVTACDFNQAAVNLAIRNAKKNNIENVSIFKSDWFESIHDLKFNLIVSNPPYIDKNDPHLKLADLVFEPTSALVAEDCGLADIKLIAQQSIGFLKPGGCLMFEHGFEQAESVRAIFENNGFIEISTIKDLAGLDRVTLALLQPSET